MDFITHPFKLVIMGILDNNQIQMTLGDRLPGKELFQAIKKRQLPKSLSQIEPTAVKAELFSDGLKLFSYKLDFKSQFMPD